MSTKAAVNLFTQAKLSLSYQPQKKIICQFFFSLKCQKISKKKLLYCCLVVFSVGLVVGDKEKFSVTLCNPNTQQYFSDQNFPQLFVM